MKVIQKDHLRIEIYPTRREMGNAAGALAAQKIKACLAEKEEVNVIFAAAPSQNEMLEALITHKEIPWERVNAFHMDEYIGLSPDAPQGFGNFLKAHIFDRLPFKAVYCIRSDAEEIQAECARYSALLKQYPVDIVLLGIGENGHIAFNDPHVADFNDPETVKPVSLDEVCRNQQVNDGCFASLDEVPRHALTLTIPTLTAARHMVCTVPAPTKAWAVEQTALGKIGPHCPSTAMRLHPDAVMFCDRDSGGKLL